MYQSDSIDQLLTVLFLLVAVAAFVIFFVIPGRILFYLVGGVAVTLRLFQYGRRMVMNRKIRREEREKRASDLDI